MQYDIKEFSKIMRILRLDAGLTQQDVFNKTGLRTDTLRRIENGQVIPKFETLDILSLVYKVDLSVIFLNSRVYQYKDFEKMLKLLERNLSSYSIDEIKEQKEHLVNIYNKTQNGLYKQNILQLIKFSETIVYYANKEYDKAYDKAVEALKISTEEFSIANFKDFHYSQFDLRILMVISHIYTSSRKFEYALDLLYFIKSCIKDNNLLETKVTSSIATLYRLMHDYKKCLSTVTALTDSAIINNDPSTLFAAYYMMGVCKYNLNSDDYIKYFRFAASICVVFKMNNRLKMFLKELRSKYNINLGDDFII